MYFLQDASKMTVMLPSADDCDAKMVQQRPAVAKPAPPARS